MLTKAAPRLVLKWLKEAMNTMSCKRDRLLRLHSCPPATPPRGGEPSRRTNFPRAVRHRKTCKNRAQTQTQISVSSWPICGHRLRPKQPNIHDIKKRCAAWSKGLPSGSSQSTQERFRKQNMVGVQADHPALTASPRRLKHRQASPCAQRPVEIIPKSSPRPNCLGGPCMTVYPSKPQDQTTTY